MAGTLNGSSARSKDAGTEGSRRSRAFLRSVSDGLARYGTADAPLEPNVARSQHQALRAALEEIGFSTLLLQAAPGQDDCCFVEDTALVLGDRALICPMGRVDRRAEQAAVVTWLQGMGFQVVQGPEQATLEGGDVLHLGARTYVGRSHRTNAEGVLAVERFLAQQGRGVVPVEVERCLHLKTGCTALDAETVLCAREWIPEAVFAGLRVIPVAQGELQGANVLSNGRAVLVPASAPRTAEQIASLGYEVHPVDISAFELADGGITCLSLRPDGEAGVT